MGAFFLARRTGGATDIGERARREFKRQGFDELQDLSNRRFSVLYCHKQSVSEGSVYRCDQDNFCVSTGTLIYKRHIGATAAQLIFEDMRNNRLDLTQLYGNFALLICLNGEIRLYSDAQGVYPVWYDDAKERFSSSFVALASLLPKPHLNRNAVYPYVFQEGTFGGDTIFAELRRLPVGHAYSLHDETKQIAPLPYTPPTEVAEDTLDAHVEALSARLDSQFEAITTSFGQQIDSALSGGYDSRLLLALCRKHGSTPQLHVYGSETSGDVQIAKRVCEGEGIPLTHSDKAKVRKVTPNQCRTITAANLLAFVGPCADGIVDNGSDLSTRRERTKGGKLLLNGGGGEVMRNFFYLPNRRYRPRELLWSFFSQFDPRICTSEFSEDAYFQRFESQLAPLTDGAKILDRHIVEYLYARFRCTYWMGHNNAINNQFGWFLTPFVEASIAQQTHRIPLRLKNHGILQAALIRRFSPTLASYPSDYGHDFSAVSPPLRRKLSDWSTLIRPPILRRYTYRLKRRDRTQWPYYLGEEYIRALFPQGFDFMSRYFDIDKVTDAGQFKRICTLEYLLQHWQASD